MYLGHRIGVVVPARDEALLLSATVAGLPPWVDRIAVIDDGSTDDTLGVARALARRDPRIRVLAHAQPRGVGGAILACEALAVLAGDNQMDPADLPRLLAPICLGRADYAKGDRFAHPDCLRAMPKDRLLGNLVLTWVTRRLALQPTLRDAQCGYTALAASWVPRLIEADPHPGYGFPNAVLMALSALGARVTQVPVRPVYGQEKSGLSASTVLRVYPGVLWRAWRRARALRAEAPEVPLAASREAPRRARHG